MTWSEILNISGQVIFWIALVALSVLLLKLVFLVAVFLFATAIYIIPWKQTKIDLRAISETKIEQRIYLDEYQFTIASEQHRKELEEKVKVIKDVESKIRKRAAELKSITAQIERVENGDKKSKKKA
ncbi:hypothetical protein BN85407530 [Alteracholeplasma palmae J233]|uniref:Uncharacterized protein n=1 Tax=Alteracholeplasma palmae (strain ATCC 49389 / J233) TaxID=1318466 RepID=U4KPV6_ALTPJ|nr:hypothetical protein [Alteracholeplasma palmae]CCV64330.1 hypothetical protein BN85407530 [Alteracholeplasma palmae J233]